MQSRFSIVLVLLVIALTAGCETVTNSLMDWQGRGGRFSEDHLKYTRMVRWGQFDKAAAYVDDESVEHYLEQVVRRKGTFQINDYEVIRKSIDREDWSATVFVRYEIHDPSTLLSRTIFEKQEWAWNRKKNRWFLNTNLFDLVEDAPTSKAEPAKPF